MARMATLPLSKKLASLMGLLALGCAHKAAPQAPLQVGVASVTHQDVPITHEWVGTLDGFVNAEIRPEVEG
jgi:membrane fusion protein (multidrug efflux system)